MKKSISIPLWFSMFLVLLFACRSQDFQPAVASSNTTVASAKIVPTQTQPESTPIPTEILILTSTPYPDKQVVLDYNQSGLLPPPFHGMLRSTAYPKLVLYSDGQMIITGKTFQQKILTEDEKDQFLSQLENLGFYKLESNQKHDPTDRLYDFGNQYEIDDMGFMDCIVLKARELCAYDPYRKFLVPEMKNILKFLDEYKPEGMTPYHPDRILIRVKAGRDPDLLGLPEKAIPWSEDFPSLESASNEVLYVEGKAAAELFSLLGGELTSTVVIQNGREYTIRYVRPVLPHEVISYP